MPSRIWRADALNDARISFTSGTRFSSLFSRAARNRRRTGDSICPELIFVFLCNIVVVVVVVVDVVVIVVDVVVVFGRAVVVAFSADSLQSIAIKLDSKTESFAAWNITGGCDGGGSGGGVPVCVTGVELNDELLLSTGVVLMRCLVVSNGIDSDRKCTADPERRVGDGRQNSVQRNC